MSSLSHVVLGIDLGTTAAKVIAFDPEVGRVVASSGRDYPTTATVDGGSEQNPADWWAAVTTACQEVLKTIPANRIAAVGLSGHMHGLLLLDEAMEPVRPAMTWSDRRVGEFTAKLSNYTIFRELGGNDVVDAFTAPKLLWLSATEPENLAKASHLVMAKDYLRFLLTGLLGTDYTDAIGTLLWDVKKGAWSDQMFELCGSSSTIAPDAVGSTTAHGSITHAAAKETGLLAGTPVVAGAGDVSAVALGAGLVNSSIVCLNVGTAAQALGAVSDLDAGSGFLFGNSLETGYLAMSSVYAAGASVRWAERVLLSSQPIEDVARESSPGSEGLTYLPYMFGAVVPRKNDSVRAAFIGQTSGHTPAHLASAVLEGVAFACADAVEAIGELVGQPATVHVVGGVANSATWRSALSSVLDCPVVRIPEGGSAVGAALLAAIGVGMSSPVNALESLAKEQVHKPTDDARASYLDAQGRFRAARDLLV